MHMLIFVMTFSLNFDFFFLLLSVTAIIRGEGHKLELRVNIQVFFFLY